MASHATIERALAANREFKLGQYISRGFELTNKNIGLCIAFSLISFVITFAVGLVLAPINLALAAGLGAGIVSTILQQVVGQLITPAVAGPLEVGYAISSSKIDQGKQSEFGDFFAGFSKWLNLYLVRLLVGLVTICCAIPAFLYWNAAGIDLASLQGVTDIEILREFDWGGVIIGGLIATVVGIYFFASFIFAPLLVWFFDLSPMDAMGASRKLVAKNLFSVIGFIFMLFLIVLGGLLFCCVGLLYAIPVMSNAVYAAFADTVDLNAPDSTDDQLIDHFTPQNF